MGGQRVRHHLFLNIPLFPWKQTTPEAAVDNPGVYCRDWQWEMSASRPEVSCFDSLMGGDSEAVRDSAFPSDGSFLGHLKAFGTLSSSTPKRESGADSSWRSPFANGHRLVSIISVKASTTSRTIPRFSSSSECLTALNYDSIVAPTAKTSLDREFG